MIQTIRNEPIWLGGLRGKALEAYRDLPFPDRVRHLWRYTDPNAFLPDGDPFRQNKPAPAGSIAPWCEVCQDEIGEEASALGIAMNGLTHQVTLPEELRSSGLILKGLKQAIMEHDGLVESFLGRLIPAESGKFEALNLAAWQDGFFLYLPKGVELGRPIHLFMCEDGAASFSAPRILAVIEEGSSLTLFTEFMGQTVNGRTGRQVNAMVELFLGEGSRLDHVTVQRLSPGAHFYLKSRARLARDARTVSVLAAFGGAMAKVDSGVVLAGEGAEGEFFGFAFGEADQHLDHHTEYEHKAPRTRSQLDFKVVLKDRARSIYTGLIRIDKDAPYCEAYQENRNVLLSEGAQAETIPELEIMTNEVRCTHGATVGPLDEDPIFYLMSRGIPREEAIRMVVGGFLEPALVRIPGGLQTSIRRCVEERLRRF